MRLGSPSASGVQVLLVKHRGAFAGAALRNRQSWAETADASIISARKRMPRAGKPKDELRSSCPIGYGFRRLVNSCKCWWTYQVK